MGRTPLGNDRDGSRLRIVVDKQTLCGRFEENHNSGVAALSQLGLRLVGNSQECDFAGAHPTLVGATARQIPSALEGSRERGKTYRYHAQPANAVCRRKL